MSLLPLDLKPHDEVLCILRKSLSQAVSEHDGNSSTQVTVVDCELIGGAYHATFFLGNQLHSPKCCLGYRNNQMDSYIDALAAFVSGNIDPEEFKQKFNYKYLGFFKATASFYLDIAFRFPPSDCDWIYEDDENEVEVGMPGSWPTD